MKLFDSQPHPFRPRADLSHTYVVTPISNSARYKRRYELYWRFKEMVESAGVKLITIEQAFGQRPFMVTESNNPMHVQVRSFEELWLKEAMINLGTARACQVDPLADKICWIDADCFPMTDPRTWFEETWHALQHYEFVQMWEHLINFGPQNQPVSGPQKSFMATYALAGFQVPEDRMVHNLNDGNSGTITFGRSGLAWAANVSALSQVGGLIDRCILGSGDWYMAHALVGAMELLRDGKEANSSDEFLKYLMNWQDMAEKWIKRDVGHVRATVGHFWHGAKEDRKYPTRGKILADAKYNPYVDVKRDAQGLYALETFDPRQIRLRDLVRDYFASRNEDLHYML